MATFRERFDIKEEVLVRLPVGKLERGAERSEWMRGRVRFVGPKSVIVAVLTHEGRFFTETTITKHHDILSMAEVAVAQVRGRSQRRGR